TVVQGVALTWATRDAFGEQRTADAYIHATFPDDILCSDTAFTDRYEHFTTQRAGTVRYVRSETPEGQAQELARITDGVFATGGARLPWYGCMRCAATLEKFTPPSSWRLVREFPAPATGYRKEPLRIWRVSKEAERAAALLKDATDAESRHALLVDLNDKHAY